MDSAGDKPRIHNLLLAAALLLVTGAVYVHGDSSNVPWKEYNKGVACESSPSSGETYFCRVNATSNTSYERVGTCNNGSLEATLTTHYLCEGVNYSYQLNGNKVSEDEFDSWVSKQKFVNETNGACQNCIIRKPQHRALY